MVKEEKIIKKLLVSEISSKKFGEVTILEDISLEISSGEIISIVGPSGIGKSTILNILCGVDNIYEGKIKKDMTRIGYVFQEDRLLPWLTLFENIKLVSNASDEIILKNLDEVGLKDYLNFFPSELSGGMKQRGSIARALTYGGDLLLLDEPFKSQDYKLRKEFLDLLIKLKNDKNISSILVTHDIDEAIYVSDRILVINGKPGKIVGEIKNLGYTLPIEEEVRVRKNILNLLYNWGD